jgi:hypothetical protein
MMMEILGLIANARAKYRAGRTDYLYRSTLLPKPHGHDIVQKALCQGRVAQYPPI